MAEPNGTTVEPESSAQAPAASATESATNASQEAKASASTPGPSDGSRKPRDARIIHLILASMGVSAYQERIPLMLMDFAYRYTTSVLQDALLYSDAIHGTANTGGPNPNSTINVDDLRMSISSRMGHQFNTSLPKEFLMEIAADRNKIALPTVGKEFGVRLPPEKYCLTGINWDLAEGEEEWMETDDEDEGILGSGMIPQRGGGVGGDGTTDAGDGMEVDESFGADDGSRGGDGGDSAMADA